eukprot:2601049-Karenia_brevis.AAC.1
MCGAPRTALKKEDGGIRPIAVGETLRRLVGKAFMAHDVVQLRLHKFVPHQLGVGVPGGAEAIVRAA